MTAPAWAANSIACRSGRWSRAARSILEFPGSGIDAGALDHHQSGRWRAVRGRHARRRPAWRVMGRRLRRRRVSAYRSTTARPGRPRSSAPPKNRYDWQRWTARLDFRRTAILKSGRARPIRAGSASLMPVRSGIRRVTAEIRSTGSLIEHRLISAPADAFRNGAMSSASAPASGSRLPQKLRFSSA